jgi:hypothetical protein
LGNFRQKPLDDGNDARWTKSIAPQVIHHRQIEEGIAERIERNQRNAQFVLQRKYLTLTGQTHQEFPGSSIKQRNFARRHRHQKA